MTIGDAVGLGALVGTLLAGVTGFLVNAALDRKAQARRLRTEAYTDFLRGVTGCSAYNGGTEQHRAFSALHMDARSRILVYGDSAVIKRVGEFWSLGAGFDSEEKQDAFVRLIQDMRNAGGQGEIAPSIVKDVLLESVSKIRERNTAALVDGGKHLRK
ncbi:MAG TPA: hypothetical protein VGL56_16870 [Fimbriimonadaceae bacterium]|jgi:hypothetical protein